MAGYLQIMLLMEISAQVNYNGYRANYKITSVNSVFYHVELIHFSGFPTENPPTEFNFIKANDQIIASSDVIKIVRDLLQIQ